jgi:predicted Zn-dependent protease with MMP-like domain
MVDISDQDFQRLINEALEELPGEHAKNIKNVAILFEDEPTSQQRIVAKIDSRHTLLGLYQGVPLSQRQGTTPVLPDRITLFKRPLMMRSNSEHELKEDIKHTLWHEIAHYYGLDHDRIHELE